MILIHDRNHFVKCADEIVSLLNKSSLLCYETDNNSEEAYILRKKAFHLSNKIIDKEYTFIETYKSLCYLIKRLIISYYKDLYVTGRTANEEVAFCFTKEAGALLNIPLSILCSPANLIRIKRPEREIKGYSSCISITELFDNHSRFLSMNPEYQALFDDILNKICLDQQVVSQEDQDFYYLNNLFEYDPIATVNFDSIKNETGLTRATIYRWLAFYSPICVINIRAPDEDGDDLDIVFGLRFKENRQQDMTHTTLQSIFKNWLNYIICQKPRLLDMMTNK